MKYTICYLLLLIPLHHLSGIDIEPVDRGEARNDYRDGYGEGAIAGGQAGQELWRAFGCFGGGAGSILGCLSIGIAFDCITLGDENGCSHHWNTNGINPYLYVAGSGCIGGIATGGSVALMAGRTGDSPGMLIGHSPEYTQGYIDGYRQITKKNKREAALVGAMIGTMSGTGLMLLWVYGVDRY